MIYHDISMVRWVTLNQLLIGRGRTLYARQFSVGSSPTPVITLVAWCFVRRLADPFLHGESLMSRVKGSNKVKHTFQAIGTIQITFDFKILYGKWKLESSKRSDCWGPLGTPGEVASVVSSNAVGNSCGLHSETWPTTVLRWREKLQ